MPTTWLYLRVKVYPASCTNANGKRYASNQTNKGQRQSSSIFARNSECMCLCNNTLDQDGWVLPQFILLHRTVHHRYILRWFQSEQNKRKRYKSFAIDPTYLFRWYFRLFRHSGLFLLSAQLQKASLSRQLRKSRCKYVHAQSNFLRVLPTKENRKNDQTRDKSDPAIQRPSPDSVSRVAEKKMAFTRWRKRSHNEQSIPKESLHYSSWLVRDLLQRVFKARKGDLTQLLAHFPQAVHPGMAKRKLNVSDRSHWSC